MKIRTWLIGLFTSGNQPSVQLGIGDTVVHKKWGEGVITGGCLNVDLVNPKGFGNYRPHRVNVAVNLKDFVD